MPCYTWKKGCYSAVSGCQGTGSSVCAPTVQWFWLLAGILGVALVVKK